MLPGSVKSYLRREVDVNHFPTSSSRSNHNQNSPEVERPLSEYDNLSISTLQSQLADIKFRFDDMSSSPQNSSNNTSTIPAHSTPKYENVIATVQMRNKRENDQRQVNMDQSDSRPVMSEAKSSFFGLNQSVNASTTPNNNETDELEKLIEDCANIKIVSSNDIQQYVNLITNSEVDGAKASPTSSASGSSAMTVSPSQTPTRDERKNSEAGSNRSKSPKFILPEISSTPSQVSVHDVLIKGVCEEVRENKKRKSRNSRNFLMI